MNIEACLYCCLIAAPRGLAPHGAGAEQVLREAVSSGARVGIVAGTCSSAAEGVVQGVLKAMDDELAPHLQVFTREDGAGQGPGGAADEAPTPPSFEQSMAAARAKVGPRLSRFEFG